MAKPDGLTLGVNNAALYFEQLLKKKEVQFDWTKFTWVGSTTPTSPLLYMWANTPYKTIHDVRTASVAPKWWRPWLVVSSTRAHSPGAGWSW